MSVLLWVELLEEARRLGKPDMALDGRPSVTQYRQLTPKGYTYLRKQLGRELGKPRTDTFGTRHSVIWMGESWEIGLSQWMDHRGPKLQVSTILPTRSGPLGVVNVPNLGVLDAAKDAVGLGKAAAMIKAARQRETHFIPENPTPADWAEAATHLNREQMEWLLYHEGGKF